MQVTIKHSLNAHEFPKTYERPVGPSKTIPDQSMSVAEIMRRYASGLPITGAKVEMYEGDDSDMPDITHMDLADREAIIDEATAELEAVKDRLNEKERQRKEKAKNGRKTPPKDDEIPFTEVPGVQDPPEPDNK